MQADENRMIQTILEEIRRLSGKKTNLLVAIDGRCASGKTTLAQKLCDGFCAAVFHMDDYFLQPEQRTKERLAQPGGNVDHERFAEEILRPCREGKTVISYRPYDCHRQMLLPPVTVSAAGVVIVEGSYSCHPALWPFYDLHIFLTVGPKEQLLRIRERNRGSVRMFQERWIPLEERYFQTEDIQKRCELCFKT